MCGIFGVCGHKNAVELTYLGLYSLQHRGQESAGMVATDGKNVSAHKAMGLVSEVFKPETLEKMSGHVTLGHVRYSTTGSSVIENAQPFLVSRMYETLSIAHNGNLTNTLKIRNSMESSGSIFQTTSDSEIIVHLIVKSKKKKIEDRVVEALGQLNGAYSILILANDMLIAARDPHGFRPLSIGEIDGSVVVASETCAFDITGARYIRDVEPGEVVVIKPGKMESIKCFKEKKCSGCIFEFIYFARPDSRIFGGNVYSTRKELGRQLAMECPAEGADIVLPIPDSGNCAAMGYARESKLPFEMGLVRNHYIGRTFIQPLQSSRDFNAKLKLNPVTGVLKNKDIVLVEDSIVRGTTSKSRIKSIRDAGVKKIHMRISCPPLKFPCFYGIDFPTKEELIASAHTVEDIGKMINVDSLEYLSMEGMLASMPIPGEKFCTACFDGNYPELIGERI